MKYKEVVKLIEDDGWFQARQKGSHRAYKHLRLSPLPIIDYLMKFREALLTAS
jgi:predicted RNA binding protein YcfA (HicA-like mRNA interferase family)